MTDPRRAQNHRLPARTWAACALGPAVALQVVLPTGLLNIVQLVGMAVAGYLLVLLARRPEVTVRLLIGVLPFQLLLTSTLYELGLNGGAVRMLGLWKEVAVLALGMAALTTARRNGRGLDAFDRLVAAYVGLGTLYLLVPQVTAAGPRFGLDDRFLSWRATVLPTVLLLIARHLRFRGDQIDRIIRTLLRVGVLLGAIALVEVVASGFWNRLLVDTIGVNRFRTEVLDLKLSAIPGQLGDIRTRTVLAGRDVVRAGGPMVGYLEFSFFLLVVLAFQLERMVREMGRPGRVVAVGLLGFGLLASQTRSAALGAVVVGVVALLPLVGRSERARVRLAVLIAGAALVVAPLALASGAGTRLLSGDEGSDRGHSVSFDTAVSRLGDAPLGNGLGSGAIGANRVGSALAVTPENQFLDVGVQLGVPGMALFSLVLLAVIVRLGRVGNRARATSVKVAAFGARAALVGLLIPCWFLQPFITPEVGWVLFALLGAAMGAADQDGEAGPRTVTGTALPLPSAHLVT